MIHLKKHFVIGFAFLMTVALAACGAAATPASVPGSGASAPQESAAQRAPAPTSAPAATRAPEPTGGAAKSANGQASPSQQTRMIIKNGEMQLLVNDTDRAIEKVTDAAVNNGGYIVSSRTDLANGFKSARITMGVPVEQFEVVQRQLRSLATAVLSDVASGQDVSDEYVDLQSQLTNQQATAARIREFLKDARTVEEALKVNDQLSQVESGIEKIKGRLQFLKDRSAFSTIIVDLVPVRPTPTPTPTATPTPTPTPTFWQPDKTAEKATSTLSGLLRFAGDAIIWIVIVLGPCLIPLALIVALIAYLRRRARKKAPQAALAELPAEPQKPASGGPSGN